MDMKTFEYLYYKTRGYTREQILEEAGLAEDEYEMMEKTMQGTLREIEADRPRAADIGKVFVRLTRYIYENRSDQELGLPRPEAVKAFCGESIPLPAVANLPKLNLSLSQAIGQRRSLRKYSPEPFSQEDLSYLLWASVWARDFRSNEKMEITLRNVPSAGARHPFECWVLVNNVTGIRPGLYYYHPVKHCLIKKEEGEAIGEAVYDGCLRQEMVKSSAVTVILSAVPYRTSWRYGQRGYRYLYLDAGHVGQNIHLAAEALNAGACMIGAFQDEAMNDALGLDGSEEFVIYVATVGKKL